jgi:hypothetical protein
VGSLTIPPNNHETNSANGRDKALGLLSQLLPDYDFALMLVNDDAYGGSGGVPAIASMNFRSVSILIHELAHSFAGLGDEYTAPYPGYPEVEERNTTRETRREFIKWRTWIDPATPIPTPETASHAQDVGLFEGAHYHERGWYRPKLDCMMQTLGQPFCEVCQEALVLAIHRSSSMIDQTTPATNWVRITNQATATFSAEITPRTGTSGEFSWMLNETNSLATWTNSLTLQSAQFRPVINSFTATFRGSRPHVRNDPFGDLEASHTWYVEVPQPALLILNLTVAVDGRISFTVNRLAEQAVLQTSSDLMTWTPISTNTFVPGENFSHQAAGRASFPRLFER